MTRVLPFLLVLLVADLAVAAGTNASQPNAYATSPPSIQSTTINNAGNPFEKFSSNDVVKIAVCDEKELIQKNVDRAKPPIFYLEPFGAVITNRTTIGKICESFSKVKVSEGHPFTGSGLLNYQVFYDKDNRILAVTSIENYQCNVTFEEVSMKDGLIILTAEGGRSGCQNVLFCRIVFDFTKKELPKVFSEMDKGYQSQGGIEKLLFNGVTVPPP